MKEIGIVKEVTGEMCRVSVKRQSACGENCATCSATCKQKDALCIAKNTAKAKVGDKVVIEIATDKVLKSAFLVYILPIIVFFFVYFMAGHYLLPYPAVIALLAMVCVFAVLFFVDRRKNADFISEVQEILEK